MSRVRLRHHVRQSAPRAVGVRSELSPRKVRAFTHTFRNAVGDSRKC